ncbi:hypothetical protein N0V83_007307 [Neocucurbitaria cava]|uniref:Uncharacterized protein n=1 Tax=Neocucurbitaria cava TaxID=798079 RepID=A0A9W8Y4I3_9PLEO|nr:hypothetical protein N0V83_007307 [Neocucurbitaria cava]
MDTAPVGPPADIELLSDGQGLVESDLSETKSTKTDIETVEHVDPAPMVETSDCVQQIKLDSPFHSPKSDAGTNPSDTSLEEGEISENILEVTPASESEAVGTQNDIDDEIDFQEMTDIKEEPTVTDSSTEFKSVEADSRGMAKIEEASQVEEIPAPATSSTSASTETAAKSQESLLHAAVEQCQDLKVDQHIAAIASEEATDKDAKETDVETPADPVPTRSVPPHLRPHLQPPVPRQYGIADSKHATSTAEVSRIPDAPRAFRSQYAPYQPRYDNDSEPLARTRAQLMKTQNELNAARKSLAQIRATVESEQQQRIEAAFSSMLSTLLQKQGEAISSKASFEAKERDLSHRERMIQQFEIYLAEGQKQVKYQLEEQGIRAMDTVDRALIEREADLVAQKGISDFQGKLAIQAERLHLREAAQTMREQQYKALVRDAITSEVLQTAVSREKAAVLGREEYARGFDAGKEEGKKEIIDEVQQGAFIRGYAACRRVQTALHDLRAGRIARDSEKLDFLFDAGHVENLFNRGVQIGRLEGGNAAAMVNGGELKGLQKATKGAEEEEVKVDEQMVRNQPPPPQAPPPPSRPTFASQLRATAPTFHNGHFVLANNGASAPPTPTSAPTANTAPTSMTKMNGINGINTTGITNETNSINGTKSINLATNGTNGINSMNENAQVNSIKPPTPPFLARATQGIYAGRRILRYEDSDEDEDEHDNHNLHQNLNQNLELKQDQNLTQDHNRNQLLIDLS